MRITRVHLLSWVEAVLLGIVSVLVFHTIVREQAGM
jgi:hypothetical protein